MTNFPVIGMKNIGNICFINSAFQCLASLKSFKTFLEEEFCSGSGLDELEFLQEVQLNMHGMQYYEGRKPFVLSHKLLDYIYRKMFRAAFNSQQDTEELLMLLFNRLQDHSPSTYANFKVVATTECQGERYESWNLRLRVPDHENSINIGQMLSEAIFLEPDQVCTCGQNRLHIYGKLPQCLAITVDKSTGTNLIRQNVQIECAPAYKINGVKYEMKAAAEYLGKDYKGGCDTKVKSFNKLPKEWLAYFEDLAEEIVPIQEELETPAATPVEEEKTSFNQVPKDQWLINFDVELPTPVQVEAIFEEDVSFKSKRRNLPPLVPLTGHYKSYVKRDEDYYHISDLDVEKVKVIETDNLYVLFYER